MVAAPQLSDREFPFASDRAVRCQNHQFERVRYFIDAALDGHASHVIVPLSSSLAGPHPRDVEPTERRHRSWVQLIAASTSGHDVVVAAPVATQIAISRR